MAGWRFEADVVTQGDVLDLLSRQRSLNFAPGTDYLYSNSGFTLLAIVVERVSGQSFRTFTAERIFEPLGMTDTHFHDDHQTIVRNRAYAYAPNDDGTLRISIPDFDTVGATSLFTTVEDLARWDHNFTTGTVGGRVVLDELLTRGTLNDGRTISYAFGLAHGRRRGVATVGHGGADAGYRSHYVRFPARTSRSPSCAISRAPTPNGSRSMSPTSTCRPGPWSMTRQVPGPAPRTACRECVATLDGGGLVA